MEDDDLLGVMLDFGDDGENTAVPPPAAAAPPPLAAGVPPGLPPGAPTLAASSPTPAASTASASSVPSLGPHAAHGMPQAMLMAQREYQGYYRMAGLLTGKHRDRLPTVNALCTRAKSVANLTNGSPLEKTKAGTAVLRNGLKQVFSPEDYEWAKQQTRMAGSGAAAAQAAPGAQQQQAALLQQQQRQQQAAAAQQQQRQAAPAAMNPQQAAQQQAAAQQAAQQRAPSRGPSPLPGAPSPAPGGAPGAQQPLTAQQVMQAQQQLMIMQHAQAQAQAQAQAAAAAAAAKRPADGGGEPAAKRAKAGGAAGGAKKKEMDDTGITLDNLYDWDQETNQLMEGLQRDRDAQRVKPKTSSNQQFLSEWRVGNEFYRQIQRTGGGLRVQGECFELVQLAFQAHMTQLVQRSLRSAGHRQDACRRSADCAVTSDPRRGVTQIERREKAKADERAEAERAKLLQEAKSKRADEETKERAQKAKAELVGKQQASLANAAVAATLGGKSKGKVNKWDKWSSAAAAGPAAGAGGEAGGAAGGKGKKRAAGKKGGGKKGAAAAESEGGSEGGAAAGSDVSGAAVAAAAAGDSKAKPAAGLPRMGLTGAASVGSDDASTIHIKDVLGCLERDPLYAKSGLLYRLYNTPRTSAVQG
ncbi:transcription initiation factor TFIID subunit 4b-like isoform X3 [Chlorella sorokiniana]|uniref:Transcription initiation factor TFIID subunit 4b-like isoform X3 n=1 Tax=Chlorella sorokiniana TaxID=3076 RepID=A0A2P6TMK4_CHLSO|nr:transcription initiation factor TFIID subunit 4b-like isoform X3 [Chlorella sorokiniana]|eukprot:PRW45535.1 transcription initiation factor TFIID subunit 4b-like isoform X3 [Chlorella sorokiniana]